MTLTVNPERFKQDFEALAEIGSTGDGGVSRPALSQAHLDAQRFWMRRAAAAGLETSLDGAGNVSAVLRSPNPRAKTLLLGSHTDSVVAGGRFDGALGVLAALEAVRTLKESGQEFPVHVEAIDFNDEEGTLAGLLGSKGLAGTLTPDSLKAPRGGRAYALEALARAGLSEAGLLTARRDPATLAGYLELHIEQGPRLWRRGIAIGVVDTIMGIRSYKLTFQGQANHAGTTPMTERYDAGLGAAAYLLAAHERVVRDFPACTVNFGMAQFGPGAFNIIPDRAELALEFRAPTVAEHDALQAMLLPLAESTAADHGLSLVAEPYGRYEAAPMSARAQAAFSRAAESLALSHIPLSSGAGHDGQSLAHLCDCGMIFIPSRDGISHSPREHSEWDDCVNGANVLLRAALIMMS